MASSPGEWAREAEFRSTEAMTPTWKWEASRGAMRLTGWRGKWELRLWAAFGKTSTRKCTIHYLLKLWVFFSVVTARTVFLPEASTLTHSIWGTVCPADSQSKTLTFQLWNKPFTFMMNPTMCYKNQFGNNGISVIIRAWKLLISGRKLIITMPWKCTP